MSYSEKLKNRFFSEWRFRQLQLLTCINLGEIIYPQLEIYSYLAQFEYCFKFRELTGCEKKRSDKYKIMSTCFEVPFFLLCLLQGNRLKAVQRVFAPVRKFSSPSFARTCTRLHVSKSPLSQCILLAFVLTSRTFKNTEKMGIEPAISPCLCLVPSKCLSVKPPQL